MSKNKKQPKPVLCLRIDKVLIEASKIEASKQHRTLTNYIEVLLINNLNK